MKPVLFKIEFLYLPSKTISEIITSLEELTGALEIITRSTDTQLLCVSRIKGEE